MKHIHSIIKGLFVFSLIIGCTKDEPKGVFDLSKAAQKYKIDTTITSFKMVDNNGITEQFYLYGHNSYYQEPWDNGFFEFYGVNYNSTLNNYYLDIDLRADDISSTLYVSWNYNDYLYYDFRYKETSGGSTAPVLKFYDSIQVRDIEYFDIIEVDYTDKIDKIDESTPVKTYISGKKGLIKLVRKDGNVLERIN